MKKIYGIGYTSEGCNTSHPLHKLFYDYWHSMLRRCYDKKRIEVDKGRNQTYECCVVCEEWHDFSNFHKWCEENYYSVKDETMTLDKDILIKGNKIYSPQTCIFAPQRINTLFCTSRKNRGKYPIGITEDKRYNSLCVRCSVLNNEGKKKLKILGYFKKNESEKAFNCYKVFKEGYIKQVADEYKPYIPIDLYNAMYSYEVEITD